MSEIKHTPKLATRKVKSFFELPATARLLGTSFMHLPFSQLLHPHAAEYPEDVDLWYLRTLQRLYYDWNSIMFVVTDTSEAGGETIVGLAQWTRSGSDSQQHGWGLAHWDPRNGLQWLVGKYIQVAEQVYPDRALCPTMAAKKARLGAFMNVIQPPIPTQRWHLGYLAVKAEYRHLGIGRSLVRWGLEQAAREGVAVTVNASPGTDEFYERCGFDHYAGDCGEDREDNPWASIPVGHCWIARVKKT